MDRLRGTLASRWWRAAVAAMFTALVVSGYVIGRDAPLASVIEGQALAWRFLARGPAPAPTNVAIIAIDDRTIAALKRWPLPRRVLAAAIEKLTRHRAAAIGIDLMFIEREQPSDGIGLSVGDLALHDALRAAPDAVIAVAFTFGPDRAISAADLPALREGAFRIVHRTQPGQSRGLLEAADALLPIEPLRDVAGLGHVNVPVDHDGTLRHLYPAIAIDGHLVPALPVELARRLMGLKQDDVAVLLGRGLAFGGRHIATDPTLRLPLAYYGPAGTIETYSMLDLLEDRIPPGRLAGRAVLIGPTAIGVGDTFVSPYSRALPGVEVLATAVANIVNGHILDHSTRTMLWDIVAIIGLAALAFAAAHLPSTPAAVAATIAVIAAWIAVTQIAFSHASLWLSLVFPVAAAVLNAGAVAVSRFAGERRLRRDMERQRGNLARYHSPLVADLLARGETGDFAEREQFAAILFVDLAGFTHRSEHMTPADTARFLRNFHFRIERAVLAHRGVLEQFTGDGAMVIFGIPAPDANDAAAALDCALALIRDIGQWSAELNAAGDAPLRAGIGIHYGPVVITRLGGARQMHLTATGDTVNVASRLEALTRILDAAIVISDAVVGAIRAVGREDLLDAFSELAPQAIRGRDEKIGIWIRPSTRPPAITATAR